MSNTVIRVENLSKHYVIRSKNGSPSGDGLRHLLHDAIATPWRRLRGLQIQERKDSATHSDLESREFWALRDVSFEVKRGEVIGIIGHNGAGKSTLLKILSRITEPTSGRVGLKGRVASLLEVGTGFHPELSGRENVFLNGAILGMTKAEIHSKFDEIVAFAEVEEFLDTPVKRYSSGMYVRLAFAVAAHLEPEILIIDEVLAVGDAAFQKRCLGKMNEIAEKDGRTVIFVSHNLNAVETLCRSAVLLRAGQVLEQGSDVRGIVTRYLHGDCPGSATSSAEWINPGCQYENPWFMPKRFAVTDADGVTLSAPASNSEGAWVEVEGNVETVDPSMNVGYAIFDEIGTLLYWSLTTDSAEAEWPRVDTGTVLFRSKLPGGLLNEGDYRLELMVSLHCRQWLSKPGSDAPAINMSIRGGLSESPYWMSRRPGLLAPVIPWQ